MAARKVEDPWQNYHEFWGSLSPNSGDKFVKLSCDAHFVSYGTFVETGKEFNSASEAKTALIKELSINNPTFDFNSIVLPEGKYFEIVAIDPVKTSPLTKELNLKTEELFRNDGWLAMHPEIGVEAIKAGRQLPRLPK